MCNRDVAAERVVRRQSSQIACLVQQDIAVHQHQLLYIAIFRHAAQLVRHISQPFLVVLKRAVVRLDRIVLHAPELVYGALNQVLVVRYHQHAALEQRQALQSKTSTETLRQT